MRLRIVLIKRVLLKDMTGFLRLKSIKFELDLLRGHQNETKYIETKFCKF